jgi:hypothetical protein
LGFFLKLVAELRALGGQAFDEVSHLRLLESSGLNYDILCFQLLFMGSQVFLRVPQALLDLLNLGARVHLAPLA